MDANVFLSLRQVAGLVGMRPVTLGRVVRAGALPAFRFGINQRTKYIWQQDVER